MDCLMEDKARVANISYGKDSLAMLYVVTDVLGWRLDRIITADVWATDTIPADLPPMVEFKDKADRIIKDRWGIEVEHFRAIKHGEETCYEEVSRVCTDGTRNACSMLYGACVRIAKDMGFRKIQTYILESEKGTSLKASGWDCEGKAGCISCITQVNERRKEMHKWSCLTKRNRRKK